MDTRHLHERDAARAAGDALACAVLDHLAGKPSDLAAALCAYRNADGPAWALPPSGWKVDFVFDSKASATQALRAARAAVKSTKAATPWPDWAITARGSRDP